MAPAGLMAVGVVHLGNLAAHEEPGTSNTTKFSALAAAAAPKSGCFAYNCKPENNCKPKTISSAPATFQICGRFITTSFLILHFAISRVASTIELVMLGIGCRSDINWNFMVFSSPNL